MTQKYCFIHGFIIEEMQSRKCISGFYRVKYHKLHYKRDGVGGGTSEPVLISFQSILYTQNTEIAIFRISLLLNGVGGNSGLPPPTSAGIRGLALSLCFNIFKGFKPYGWSAGLTTCRLEIEAHILCGGSGLEC